MAILNDGDVYARVREATREYGVARWCDEHGLSPRTVREYLCEERLPTKQMLRALGLKWAIVEVRESADTEVTL